MDKSATATIFSRSLTINASLNFRTMQNLGFCFSLIPLIRGREPAEKRAFLTRHLRYFATHPYFAPAVIGAVVKEEEAEEGKGEASSRIKETLMGPYAALGDQFFWGRWLPCASLVAVVSVFFSSPWAPVFFLLLFLPPQLWVRWRGYQAGYRWGRDSFRIIHGWKLMERGRQVRRVTAVVLAVGVFSWAYAFMPAIVSSPIPLSHRYALAMAVFFGGFVLARRRISPLTVFYGMCALIYGYQLI